MPIRHFTCFGIWRLPIEDKEKGPQELTRGPFELQKQPA